jgi:hypothetical protein
MKKVMFPRETIREQLEMMGRRQRYCRMDRRLAGSEDRVR